MVKAYKQASNSTGLWLAREVSPGVVDNAAVWVPQEPNSYKDFGASYKTITRNPINPSRQRKKGSVVDMDANGGWQEDLTYDALTGKIEGLMYAAFRASYSQAITAIGATSVTLADASAVHVGDVIAVKHAAVAANNGAKHVTAVAGNVVTVAEAMTVEAAPPAATVASRAGRVFAASDIAFDVDTKTLTTAASDFTTLGLLVGDWVYLSADVAAADLGANLGMARIAAITPGTMRFDKMQANNPDAPITDAAGTGKTVALYLPSRRVRNEATQNLIKRQTYQAERTLGYADTADAYEQREYLTGCVINEGHFVFNTADKVTVDWSLVASAHENRAGTAAPKAGTRAVMAEGSAYNTSTDVKRMNIALVGSDVPQFAYVMDVSLTVKNNNKANKAVSVMGAIDHTEGQFIVSAAVTAYFQTVEAARAIENNSDVTLDLFIANENSGIVFDLPLVTLGDGRPKITANEVIQLPLDIEAATAAKLSPDTNYTLSVSFFDYLPNAAMA